MNDDKQTNQPSKEEELKKTREIADRLPKITLISPVHNCQKMFFLMLGNFMMLNYPHDKLEWVIVDDGDYSIEKLLPPRDSRIKYYYIDTGGKILLHERLVSSLGKKSDSSRGDNKKKMKGRKKKSVLRDIHKDVFHEARLPIGLKRNICCQYATGELIMHFDIDYFYPYDSLYIRAAKFVENKDKLDVIGSTQIGSFHCSKYVSLLYNDTGTMALNRRLNDASIAYRKSFWESCKFDNQDIVKECEHFVKGRTDKLFVIDGLLTTVLILHKDIEKKYPKVFEKALAQKDPNGWHFGKLPDKFFIDITKIDEVEDENDNGEVVEENDEDIPVLEFTK